MVSVRHIFFLCFVSVAWLKGQVRALQTDEAEKMYTPYMLFRHQGAEGLAEFKKSNPEKYHKELWYYSSSFYIKRDHFPAGVPMDAALIDISRYESNRKEDEEQMVILEGFRDVLVLFPVNELLFRPVK